MGLNWYNGPNNNQNVLSLRAVRSVYAVVKEDSMALAPGAPLQIIGCLLITEKAIRRFLEELNKSAEPHDIQPAIMKTSTEIIAVQV